VQLHVLVRPGLGPAHAPTFLFIYHSTFNAMKTIERSFPSNQATQVIEWSELERDLEFVALYEDEFTAKWPRELEKLIAGVVGKEALSRAFWKLSDLNKPGVLADVVRATARADVIVVSVYDHEDLPLECHAWVEAWLPHRLQVRGALIGFIAAPDRRGVQPNHIQAHLRAVADEAGLDFFSERWDLDLVPQIQFVGSPKSRRFASEVCATTMGTVVIGG
jgi:hypothetical protein